MTNIMSLFYLRNMKELARGIFAPEGNFCKNDLYVGKTNRQR